MSGHYLLLNNAIMDFVDINYSKTCTLDVIPAKNKHNLCRQDKQQGHKGVVNNIF